MTGFGSPCSACKFLRRKCMRGCIFAPYFCHERGAACFATIHKVFGASNLSKLLLQLPTDDRREVALTISYEVQARLQDPVYGCISHIFALRQQVVNLQSQLSSLKAQAAMQGSGSACSTTTSPKLQEERFCNEFSPHRQDLYQTGTLTPNASSNRMMNYGNGLFESNCVFGSPQDFTAYSDLSNEHAWGSTNHSPSCDMEENLRSLAVAYLHRT